jgi:hypothetical protein
VCAACCGAGVVLMLHAVTQYCECVINGACFNDTYGSVLLCCVNQCVCGIV